MIRAAYNRTVRPLAIRLFGRRPADFNGVTVRYPALTDLTRRFDHKPEMMALLDRAVREGDHVVEVGTGRGALAVHAARLGATVTSHEGSQRLVERAEETADMNGVADDVQVEHAIVGEPVDVWGETEGVSRRSAAELPRADVLVLDCEGSELSIIDGLDQRPRAIVVETHASQEAPTADVIETLEANGYRVEASRPMGPGKDAVMAR